MSARDREKRGEGGGGEGGLKVGKRPRERERPNQWSFLLLACLSHFVLTQLNFILRTILRATPSQPSCLRTTLPSVFQNFHFLLFAGFCRFPVNVACLLSTGEFSCSANLQFLCIRIFFRLLTLQGLVARTRAHKHAQALKPLFCS